MSRFIESIKILDKKPQLLDYHQSRVNNTFVNFEFTESIDLAKIIADLDHQENGLFKLKIVYDLQGNFTTQMIPYLFGRIKDFELVTNDTIDYSFKYEDRSEIESMKNKSYAEEIIIVKDNKITDTSYANLLFRKKNKWYTPTSYLLNGVQRQNLLKTNKIEEAEITLDNIQNYSHLQIINAMNTNDNDFIYTIEQIINLPKDTSFLEF